MKYLILLLPILLVSCEFDNPLEKLKPKEVKSEFKNGLTEPMYKCKTPGVPVGSRTRLGGLYEKFTPAEVADMVGKPPAPPPDPRHELKAWITLLAKIATGLGLLGMIAAAVLFVYQNPAWDDVGIVTAVSFSAGLTVAVSYNLIVIVIPILTLCCVGYFGYVVYQKHKKQHVNDNLVDAFDFVKNIEQWDDVAKEKLEEYGLQSEVTKKHVRRSLKRRGEKRNKKIRLALAELGATD